jgi:glycosyltransferase involved in cell wall biosynthesis
MIRTVTTCVEQCFLEICIPTYNRSRELRRLLDVLEHELENVSASYTVRISISDNCSPDDTQAMLARHPLRDRMITRTQPSNVGALLNIWELLERANAQYVWIVSDDDIPRPGSLARIISTLYLLTPAVLTFEFDQPPGTVRRRHGDGDGIEEFSDLTRAVPHLLVLGKLTKYVFSGVHLNDAVANMENRRSTGYGWLIVILEVLRLADKRTVVVDHEFLAGCDENFTRLTDGLTPRFWDDYLLVLDHPLVSRNCPGYANGYRRGHDSYIVQLIYGVLAGTIETSNVDVFEKRGRELSFDMGYCRNPFVLLEWLCLRMGIPALRVVCALEASSMSVLRRLVSPLRRQVP